MQEAALKYSQLGYKVFPLRVGLKKPLGALVPHGVLEATGDEATIRNWFAQVPTANVGLACEGLIVIDCDPGNTWPSFERLKSEATCPVQSTPRGGLHFVFRRPEGKAWTNTQGRVANHIDTRTDGGYIVADPSHTIDCPEEKTVEGDYRFETPLTAFEELPEPPDWLIAELDEAFAPKPLRATLPTGPPPTSETDVVQRAIAYLDACPPAVTGQGGHNHTFVVTQALVHGFCLEPETAMRLLREYYNPRCEPAWSEKELQHKVDSALKNPSDKPRGWLRDTCQDNPLVDLSGILGTTKQHDPGGNQGDTEETTQSSALGKLDPAPSRKLQLIRADLIEMRPPDWLLRGTLERDTFALIFGDPGCGKSFLAIDWACRIATRTPWRGNDVQAGSVVYVAGEGQQGFGRRVRAWSDCNGVDLTGIPLFVAPAVAIPNPADLVALVGAIDASAGRPALIVVDTLARCFGGGDENSTQDMSQFVSACDVIRRRYGCTILVVHHTGHGDKSRARGAIALKAALDAEYRLENNDHLVLTATKMKDAETPPPVTMELVTVDLPGLVDEYGNPITSAAINVLDADISALVSNVTSGKRGKWQRIGLEIAQQLIAASRGGQTHIKDWHHHCEAAGMRQSTRYDVLAKLHSHGDVTVNGDWMFSA